MNITSASLDSEHSEYELANIEHIASRNVTPLSVKQSPIRYECSLREVISLGDLPSGGTVVMLDVLSVYVRDDLYCDGNIQQQLIDSVGKMGGDGYSLTSHLVSLDRP
jgi:flavin reductase (DIM6/NTAB) family NADH-FMN oxidoreductase RutF